MDFEQLIKQPEYDFLRENEHLNGKIIFLTLGGSHAYGTNVATSDVDIRGCALNSRKDLLGLSSFDQFVHEGTDTTIYSFNKLVSLLMNCNPNTIEMLGCKKEHYIYMTDLGQQMIDNSHLFLSRRACASFGGYAQAQLRRLENNLARHTYENEEKERHILGSLTSAMTSFNDRYRATEDGAINLYLGDNHDGDGEKVLIDIDLKAYPLKDMKNMLSEFSEIVKTYGKLTHRNRKKDDAHLNKHAMHLIRLYMMCIDILERELIITYRNPHDRELLLRIRNGEFQKSDGTFSSDFFDMLRTFEKKMEYAQKNTFLPPLPNYSRIEEFVMDMNQYLLNHVRVWHD